MRTQNREINIFNMSLLDILTGMLGAFLFLMLGLLPFYAKAIKMKPEEIAKQNERNKDLEKQLEELKKLADQANKGPLTPEEIQRLRNQIAAMQQRVADLQAQNQKVENYAGQLENQLADAKQKLAAETEEAQRWLDQNRTMTLSVQWDSDAVDIDIFVLGPKGTVFGPKKEKLLGTDVFPIGSDSHGANWKSNSEGLIAMLAQDGPGDYLIFYRVPAGAVAASYANLNGTLDYRDILSNNTDQYTFHSSLPDASARLAKPGGLYAWILLNYEPANHSLKQKPFPAKLPGGITLPK